MIRICESLEGINHIAQSILDNYRRGIIILQGDLAAGKTTLVKAIVKQLGVHEPVSSPTFSLQQCYGENIFHYDIYNHGLEHFMSLGLLEELEKEGLHLVEWGNDQLVDILCLAGFSVMHIEIEKDGDKRCYTMTKKGDDA